MIRTRFKCCWFWLGFWWFVLSIMVLSGDSSSIKQSRGRYIAQTILRSWHKQAEDQLRARLLLPMNVESSYTPPQIISNRGYPVEIHHVTTDDGYILELHRIPSKSTSKKVVFLQHGVLESSGTWLVNPSSRSLAILLASKGYDVWLGNSRGNPYSRAHVSLSPKSSEFWKFSWDQLGNYDIPSVVNYILQQTGQSKLSYIGHSLGCAMFFIAMIKHPELNDKIEVMVALAPLSSFANFNSFIRVITPYTNPIEKFLKRIGTRGWLDSQGFGDVFLKLSCEQTYSQARFCRSILNLVAGPHPQNLDLTLLPMVNAHIFEGTSVAVIAQFAQNYNAGEVFQAYDYGENGNLAAYGSNKPLVYNLRKVTAPVYVFSGGNDYIVAPKDVDWLLTQLGNVKSHTRFSDYNHLDFVWGTDVKERLYDQVMALLPSP